MTPADEPDRSAIALLLRPWRAHPELDGMGDGECRELIDRHWRRWPPRYWVVQLAATFAGFLAFPLVAAAVFFGADAADAARSAEGTTIVIAGGLGLAGALGSSLAVRQLLTHLLVRATLRRIVKGAVCPRCGQSLIGLPIFDDANRPEDQSRKRVRCPECGKIVRLVKHGYSPLDLAPWEQRVLPRDFQVRRRDQPRL